MKGVLIALMIMASNATLAGSITIFTNDANPIRYDEQREDFVVFPVNNMDMAKHAKRALNERVQVLVQKQAPGPVDQRYKAAFYEFLNSDQWPSMNTELEKANSVIFKAVQMRVEKIPAIVFDEKYVVYGVTSLAEAFAIYDRGVRP
ncbi:hypothetical protein DOK_11811 [gamma proteobacterium BDW918]|nr:hypothetical protein DOK_11811 [gamma proteobacterium BDW918]